MAKNKPLTVPQNGTQPSMIPSPIDKMLSGNSATDKPAKSANKRPTSFHINQDLLNQFKACCASKGRIMSNVIEELITKYIKNS